MITPVFFGCQTTRLSPEESEFFDKSQPAGLILFSRNIENAQQLRQLVTDFHQCIRHEYPMVLIDQEGGRVQRLGPPEWPQWPGAADIGCLYRKDPQAAVALAQASAKTIAHSLSDCGIRVNAAPVLDLTFDYGHSVIGNRSFGSDINSVVELGTAFVDYFLQSGIMPVIKHIPGHGRALVDSHYELPRIDLDEQQLLQSDCIPFIQLAQAPAAMTAHILYSAFDELTPMTLSSAGISWLRNTLGYQGLLISDCLHMKALRGSIASLACKAQQSGMDLVIDSHTDIEGKMQVFDAIDPAKDITIERLHAAWQAAGTPISLASESDWKLVDEWHNKTMDIDPTEALSGNGDKK